MGLGEELLEATCLESQINIPSDLWDAFYCKSGDLPHLRAGGDLSCTFTLLHYRGI